ncbi:DUF2490 domain-containing protein [Telluribacter sp. SYSU D00476]|uniref:DUF2490 domain-containing protein n=1 Tax=Telluribacter sp. SYSU D00476 TaxID=2811430 RepID=UPI001FF62DE1|nr:DUF2490 domain-containing protein [Telluribacter sp. SYSU D00476]
MQQRIVLSLFLLLHSLSAWAQTEKRIDERTQIWGGYFNQTRLTDRWGVWTDIQLRTKEELVQDLSQGVVRVGLMYYLNDQTKLTAGYAFMNHFPNEGHANISRPEHRPWQQIQWHTNGPRSQVSQRIRLEERFRRKLRNDSELGEGYAYTTRIRYNLQTAFPLTRRGFTPGGVSLVLNDELHVNLGKKIVYNYFDQNRFFVGLGFHLSRTTTLQTGYMNLFQQLPAGNQYRNLHTARIYLYQNLDVRKPKG